MKISVDKKLTTIAQAEQVKADIKEFKARYTDGDLVRLFCDTFGVYPAYSDHVISVSGEAFPGGLYYNDATHFYINIITTNDAEFPIGFCRMSFYCDLELTVNTGEEPRMWKCELFDRRA